MSKTTELGNKRVDDPTVTVKDCDYELNECRELRALLIRDGIVNPAAFEDVNRIADVWLDRRLEVKPLTGKQVRENEARATAVAAFELANYYRRGHGS